MTRNALLLPAAAAAALAAPALLAGCGTQDADAPGAGPGAGDRKGAPRYRVTATVLEDASHGPQLCRAMTASIPPQCGGPDVAGWDWDAVESTTQQKTTFTGSLALVGTWDGERFTLTQKPQKAPPSSPADEPDLTTPCEELRDGRSTGDGGGWRQALEKERKRPGYAGVWLDGKVVNVRVTGDPRAAERRIRGTWRGPLCVTGAERSEAALKRIQRQVNKTPQFQGSGIDTVRNAVTLEVVAATPELERDLDRRHGKGAVLLDGWLEPVG